MEIRESQEQEMPNVCIYPREISDLGARFDKQLDLEGAKDVQQAFFRPQTFSIPCISCETFYQPAHSIGGDYYDFLSLQGGRWGIAIGDVSGKKESVRPSLWPGSKPRSEHRLCTHTWT